MKQQQQQQVTAGDRKANTHLQVCCSEQAACSPWSSAEAVIMMLYQHREDVMPHTHSPNWLAPQK